MSEIIKNLDKILIEMGNSEMPIDANASQTSIQRHQNLHPIIMAVPIDEFEKEINRLREGIVASGSHQQNELRKRNQMNESMTTALFINPDFTAIFPHLINLLRSLVATRYKENGFIQKKNFF